MFSFVLHFKLVLSLALSLALVLFSFLAIGFIMAFSLLVGLETTAVLPEYIDDGDSIYFLRKAVPLTAEFLGFVDEDRQAD